MKKKFIVVFILIVFTLSLPFNIYAKSSNKSTEDFANLVVFVQLDGKDPTKEETNFMNTKIGEYTNAPSYKTLAIKYYDKNSLHIKALSNYLKTISYNQFNLTNYMPQYNNDTITPILGSGTSDDALIKSVSSNLDVSSLSGLDIDKNNDGYIDNLTIIAQGSASDRNEDLYPHKANYPGNLKIAGKQIYTYNIINSSQAFEGSNEGVIAHEFLHSIGFSDLYKYNTNNETPVGRWDIMAGTSSFMQYPLMYTLSHFKGWIDIDEITSSKTNLTLDIPEKKDGNQAYILKSPLSDKEFFVVEYKKKGTDIGGLNYKLPGSGIIIYRVDTSVDRIANSESQNGIMLFSKDVNTVPDDVSVQTAFFSKESGRDEFGSTDLKDTTNILKFSDGSNSGIKIKNIGSANSDAITFDVDFADTSKVENWLCLGNKLDEQECSQISITQNKDNIPYVAYTKSNDAGTINNLYVKRYVNNKWELLGTSSANSTNSSVTNPKIFIFNNTPYVTYQEEKNSSFFIKCLKYEDNKWVNCNDITSSFTQYYNGVVSNDGIYFVTSNNDSAPYSYDIKRFDGENVTTIKPNLISGDLYNPYIAKDKNNIYIDTRKFPENKVNITKYSLETKTSNNIDNDIIADGSKILAENDNLYIVASTSSGLKLYKENEDNFSQVGESLTPSSTATFDIKSNNNTIYIALTNQSTNKTSVWYLKDSALIKKGLDVDSKGCSDLDFTVQDGYIYIAYLDSANSIKYPIVRYNKTPDNTGQEVATPTKPAPSVGNITGLTWNYKNSTSSSINVKWNKNDNTTGYKLYRASSKYGTYELITTITNKNTTAYTNKGLSSGKVYYYKIKGYIDNTTGSYSGIITASTLPSKPSFKVKNKKHKAKLYLQKGTSFNSYKIYRSRKKSSKYKLIKTVSSKTSSYTDKKVKRNKKYYYKIRRYKTVNGKTLYSSYSSIKSVKIK